tara:strand:+ start:54 stop:692 length:639 start_codon:yes stop_codon:yes gene_type:complete
MGKKKKLQAEIDRLNAQKPPTPEITSYKNLDQTPRTSVAAVLGSAMTGYKTSSGPSMYGAAYNYKNIASCGPSMEGKKKGLERMDETDDSKLYVEKMPIGSLESKSSTPEKLKGRQEHKEEKVLRRMGKTDDSKLADKIEGKHAGIKKMAAESLFRLGEAGVKSVASLIANKRKASLDSSNAFATKRSGGGSGYSSTRQPSYAQLMNKYQSK